MKKELPLPLIIVAVLAVVGVIGYFFVTKMNAPSEVTIPDSKMMRDRMMGQQQSGQLPAPAQGAGTGPQGGGGGAGMQQRMMQQYQSGGRQPAPPGPR